MSHVREEWHCEGTLPGEEELKTRWENRRELLVEAIEEGRADRHRHRERLEPLLDAAGLDGSTLEEWTREHRERTRELIDGTGDRTPSQSSPEPRPESGPARTPPATTPMGHTWKLSDAGRLDYPDLYGYWWRRNGESEEDPSWDFDIDDRWLRARAESRGEWSDEDFSRVHVYYGYHLTPSASGFLQLSPDQCLIRGEWYRWSKNRWWNNEHIEFSVDVSIEMHQDGQGWIAKHTENVWGQTNRTIYRPGYRTGRQDHVDPPTGAYVNAGDQVTVKMGMTLKTRARSGGSQMLLDFYESPHQGFQIPGIDWYIP